jgi:RNA recognition motif-containing protein
MADSDSGKQAIQELNGHHFMDKNLIVNEARPKTDNSRERYGNRGGGGGNKRW